MKIVENTDRASVWYMHDNSTFSPLTGTLESILEQAREWAKKSPYGMLCSVTILKGKTELRRVGGNVHARKELGDTAQWEAEVRADPDAIRLLLSGISP